jgi:hypothetical protein
MLVLLNAEAKFFLKKWQDAHCAILHYSELAAEREARSG